MKLLLDQGLPRSTVNYLTAVGIQATHVGEMGYATATDEQILTFAEQEACVIATLDADFHALLALCKAQQPSIIRLRIEGLKGKSVAQILQTVVENCAEDLYQGAAITVQENRIRVRRLPFI